MQRNSKDCNCKNTNNTNIITNTSNTSNNRTCYDFLGLKSYVLDYKSLEMKQKLKKKSCSERHKQSN